MLKQTAKKEAEYCFRQRELWVSAFTEWMIRMGRYFPLVLIGCIEIVAAVLLLGVIPARRRRAARRGTDAPERARLFLKELAA